MNQNQYKFTEGDFYQFKIIDYTEIPDTNDSFFILKNQWGGKHLLKAFPFKHYNLTVGIDITCRIDKINCSGKIFLEPENPFYKPGEIYDFDVIRFSTHTNSVGEKESIIIVKDRFGHENSCSMPENLNPEDIGERIKCKVVRIKKGQLFLIHSETENTRKLLQIGEKYAFTVYELKDLNGVKYYILHDGFGNSYSLKMDMYKHYNLCIGRQVECTVTKFDTDGQLKIEPNHPHYKIGKTYPFKFLRIENDPDLLDKNSKIIIVIDVFGIETKVSSFKPEIFNKPMPEYLHCLVEGVRKGKAILSIL
ncbi:MAG: hypothetical protein AB7S50_02825 [Bacteroidales bacterium]